MGKEKLVCYVEPSERGNIDPCPRKNRENRGECGCVIAFDGVGPYFCDRDLREQCGIRTERSLYDTRELAALRS